ncbi:Lysine histidine transporter-like 8 [Apostasia shenzhenica]|uniref:Lysine histidine transporter-like 8 n=1 Tax=Apostasia shenzhenica TaxID=1088818 RepID=A0A2I0AKF9_9ASPA|nr:Lysine histidine transporter-like 8 [Apostasia shenzhenica]
MAAEVPEIRSSAATPVVSAPPSQMQSPRVEKSPEGSPMRKAVATVRGYLEDVGHLTKLERQDSWLPITESRNGNAYYSAFHTLSSGIGIQALVLPVAFTYLGWTWGIICLSLAFIWQLYTLWLLIYLHESIAGIRFSRYLHLATTAFGQKLGKLLAIFPTMYLSAGTCSALIIVGGSSMKLFYQIVCGPACASKPLTAVEWYVVFACLAAVLAQLPNLNSIAGVSLAGAITAVSYCTVIWVVSVGKGRLPGVSYAPAHADSGTVRRLLDICNALGIIAFAFRGHNVVLEIQGTMPSTLKHPSRVPMWRGVKAAYLLIFFCLYPVAIGGFWAYGNKVPPSGILQALYTFHAGNVPAAILGLTTLLVVINCLSSFQIYAMPIFDKMEAGYTEKKNRPCPRWLRSAFRGFFVALAFLLAVAFPFLSDMAALIGAIALPVTLAYPCFMWVILKKPKRFSAMWYINWSLGSFGMGLSSVLAAGGLWNLVDTGFRFRFFKPQ